MMMIIICQFPQKATFRSQVIFAQGSMKQRIYAHFHGKVATEKANPRHIAQLHGTMVFAIAKAFLCIGRCRMTTEHDLLPDNV